VVVEALIKTDRGGKALNKGIGGFAETAAPGFFGGCGLVRVFLIRHGLSFLLSRQCRATGDA
jgi:hypothetical protein